MDLIIGTGAYPWMQFYGFRGQRLDDHLDEAFAAAAAAGLAAWEPFAPDETQAAGMKRLADKHALSIPSVYLNARLHTSEWRRTVDQVVASARIATTVLGATVMVVNPEPISWNDKQADKSDDQLRTQAGALRELTEGLRGENVTLAYHTHDMEMRQAAREFHHMLIATRDVNMGLCLDNHWVYRGAGNSQVALDDVIALYGDRVVSLHLRQSRDGTWTETLQDGDIDFTALVATLRRARFSGPVPVMIEQAYEDGTPRDLSMTDSLRRSRAWVERAFTS